MTKKNGYNRRDFLKIVGATTGMAAAGCARELPEKIIPYVVQPDEVIPGVATWYSGACGECSAGCGIMVRTREGRVVKVEGNPGHPINKGGLCAVGQSSVQGLYDPDRVREPLKRKANGAFEPVSWEEAIAAVSEAIGATSKGGKESVFLTGPLTGSAAALTDEVTGKIPGSFHVAYNLYDNAAFDAAAEEVFGAGTRLHFDFAAADVIVGFGADYLGTWISPVEFTKSFANRRAPEEGAVNRVYHVEPRLSLTAANADRWIKNRPGSEAAVMRALLALVAEKSNASGAVREAVSGADVRKLLSGSGVSRTDVESMAEQLLSAPTSLVVAGGPSVTGAQAVECAVLANLLNAALGNIGKSVIVRRAPASPARRAGQGYASIHELLVTLQQTDKIGVLFISGVNPAFTLPESAKFNASAAKAGMVVALSTHLNETARLANIVLPMSTNFEAWNDAEPAPGVYNLNQPAMQPLYKTLGYGDTLIALAASKALAIGDEETPTFQDYIKAQWKRRVGAGDFDRRWLELVQNGGDWSNAQQEAARQSAGAASPRSAGRRPAPKQKKAEGLTLIAYPTVLFADGSTTNRPWMQEIPDPLSRAVWGSWIEIHPDTAARYKLKKNSVAEIITPDGSLTAPIYLTKHIHPDAVAVPIGQGHDYFGRFASGVGANPLKLMPLDQTGSVLVRDGVKIRPSVAREKLVIVQGSDSQHDREILRTVSVAKLGAAGAAAHAADHSANGGSAAAGHADGHNGKGAHGAGDEGHGDESHGEAGHGGGHHDPYALGPQPEPPQMYEQMKHAQYRWGMTIDLARCTGCAACVTACYAENNIAVVGKELCDEGRELSWIRINRFIDENEEQPVTGFQPMLCQHCGNAPCEPVCPVYATYHSDEGLNTMVYNRCVGTRYCSNNCSYKVRRFNWFHYEWPEPLNWQLNPDVTVRSVGVMEKCTFCIQRIREVENNAKNLGRTVVDGEVQPACASTCPADAIRFGNLLEEGSLVRRDTQNERSYRVLDSQLNTQPAITYLAEVTQSQEDAAKS